MEQVLPDQQPSVGRIVHYVSHGTPPRADGTQAYESKCRAAVVTELCEDGDPDHDGCVSLAVFNPGGQFFNRHVGRSDGGEGSPVGGTWHWPERV
jgi:hypothetical protein